MGNFKWGEKSKKVLSEIDPGLARVANLALNMGLLDFALVCGKRDKKEQNKKYKENLSEKKFPNSKHNLQPGRKYVEAFDAYPVIDGRVSYNPIHCVTVATIILICAKLAGQDIIWGGDWDQDWEAITDQGFQDLGHFERAS